MFSLKGKQLLEQHSDRFVACYIKKYDKECVTDLAAAAKLQCLCKLQVGPGLSVSAVKSIQVLLGMLPVKRVGQNSCDKTDG